MDRLYCGAAGAIITPDASLWGRLEGLKRKHFGGVIDDIHFRVISFRCGGKRALLGAYELTRVCRPKETQSLISAHTGIPEENIFLFATHTHAVPCTELPDKPGDPVPEETAEATAEYVAMIQERVLASVDAAIAAEEPARIGWSWGESAINAVRNRSYTLTDENGEEFEIFSGGPDFRAPADRKLFALRAESLSGEPIAFLINYCVHNVATIWNDFKGDGTVGISSDIGGSVSRWLEEQNPGAVAVWSSGAAGNLNPVMLNELSYPDPVTGNGADGEIKGLEVALVSLKLMASRHFEDVKRTLKTVSCSITDGEIQSAYAWSRTPGTKCISGRGEPPVFVTGTENGVPEHALRIQLIQLGELAFYGVNGELFNSFAQVIRDSAPVKEVVVFNHVCMGLTDCQYVIDDESFEKADASRGMCHFPGYTDYRNTKGYLKASLQECTREVFRRAAEE